VSSVIEVSPVLAWKGWRAAWEGDQSYQRL
jgi:hypothetical protein